MADVAGYPGDPFRTFPTGDPYVRRAEFGEAGLVTYLINVGTPAARLTTLSACISQADAADTAAPVPGVCLPSARRTLVTGGDAAVAARGWSVSAA